MTWIALASITLAASFGFTILAQCLDHWLDAHSGRRPMGPIF